ncbi:hypothetical protein EP47_07055 [Legionella norrlandica]|uniref:Nickel insertion protein n=1 Tax=Legionella norrlandica TaxID=1498499 RepID=A0A0A2SWX7_9GAMM|nr:LarC family nickel insertion protein [Legionella norrlandica]KGP63889.1 hypothetical protein EP47_07055 [Legionella norrlandica]
MKTLYLESIAGIAGDMFAASFVDAGLVFVEELQSLSTKLGFQDITVKISVVNRASLKAAHLVVLFNEEEWVQRFSKHGIPKNHHSSHAHVPFKELERVILNSQLESEVKLLAGKILNTLAEAEAQSHGVAKEKVVFHELGMLDSLMDIVMAAYCITKVKPDLILASPVKLGRGLILTAHGQQPVPPAVSAALCSKMWVASFPVGIEPENIELSTPTGLAILKALEPVFVKEWPSGRLLITGNGAGTMDLGNYPNLFRINLFEAQQEELDLPYEQDAVFEVVANYDDITAERLAWAAQKLFEYGALDVWQTTAVGKKGRVAMLLFCLVEEATLAKSLNFILQQTSTFGVRYERKKRVKLKRYFENRATENGVFQVKIGCDTRDNKIKEKFEFEEIKELWDNNVNDSF